MERNRGKRRGAERQRDREEERKEGRKLLAMKTKQIVKSRNIQGWLPTPLSLLSVLGNKTLIKHKKVQGESNVSGLSIN